MSEINANEDAGVLTEASTATDSKPGKRPGNPLASLASYNYQLSLYMITPDAYDAFTSSGRTNIDALQQEGSGGAFLIAQSGGINNNNPRAPGFEFDYYIDNLEITQAISGKATNSATNLTDISFTLTEPYGFSFITQLKKANDALQQYSADLGYSKGTLSNPSKQFFILGISFLGYNSDGTPAKDNKESGALFQTYHDLQITSINFKIDGKIIIYKIKGAAIAPGMSFGTKRGRIPSPLRLTAHTIGYALTEFTKALTKQQEQLKEAGSITTPNTFSYVVVGDDKDKLLEATMVSKEDTDKFKWPNSDAKNSGEVNISTENKAIPESSSREISYAEGASVLEIFDDLVKQSSYLLNALNVVYTTALEPENGGRVQGDPKANEAIAWYHVTPELSKIQWDPKVSDWAYHTTYIFETYQTPVITSAYVNPSVNYYGPHKRYKYWYTGENSEVLKYEQTLDNLFYNVVLGTPVPSAGAATGIGEKDGTDAASEVGTKTSEPSLGKLGMGSETQNSYVTSLYSPTDYGSAKIKILGDPDFITSDQTSSIESVYNRFYGTTGFNVNANGGQVFIEIDFKEAVDYDGTTGVLDINDSVLFWEYPENIAEIVEGVSYQVITVKSSFKNGTFTQDLDLVINAFPNSSSNEEADERENADAAGIDSTQTEGSDAGTGPAKHVTDISSSNVSGGTVDGQASNDDDQSGDPVTSTGDEGDQRGD